MCRHDRDKRIGRIDDRTFRPGRMCQSDIKADILDRRLKYTLTEDHTEILPLHPQNPPFQQASQHKSQNA